MIDHRSEITAPGRRDGLREEICLLITTPRGVVVVSKPEYPEGCLRLPTGGIENGESPEDAAVRELAEELGIVGVELRSVATISYAEDSFRTLIFLGELSEASPVAGDELSAVRIAPVEGLPNVAARLEGLADSDRPNGSGTWRQWGVFRAVAHRAAADVLASRGIGSSSPAAERTPHRALGTEVRVLGPVEVVDRDVVSLVGRGAQILASLALASPEKVSIDRLREWHWPDGATDVAVHSAVSRLREKAGLSADDQLVTIGNSYALRPDRLSIDALTFREVLDDAQASYDDGEFEAAAEELRHALQLWRGTPGGGELDDSVGMRPLIASLVDSHLRARELALRVDLALGKHQAVAIQAHSLCNDDPFRESAYEVLALGLYRSGQQHAALASIQRVRTLLRDEAGIALGPGLSDLELRILEQDPSLLLPEKATYRSSQGELLMYWGYRPAAHADIRTTIREAKSAIVAAGLGLSTVIDIISDPKVIRAVCLGKPDITFVIASSSLPTRQREDGGKYLETKVKLSTAALQDFFVSLHEQGYEGELQLLTYTNEIVPRHFFLKVDDELYVGSYMSHREGSHSYLMKLRDNGDELFDLFNAELSYVLSHTQIATEAITPPKD